jgi:hypothetical protein
MREILAPFAITWALRAPEEGKLEAVRWSVPKGLRSLTIEVPGVVPPLSLELVVRTVIAWK